MKSRSTVTVLCLVQLLIVVVGYLLTRVLVRLWDGAYDPDTFYCVPAPVNLARRVVRFGLWTLIVPLAWCCVALLVDRPDKNPAAPTWGLLVAGLLVTLALALAFSVSAVGVLWMLFMDF